MNIPQSVKDDKNEYVLQSTWDGQIFLGTRQDFLDRHPFMNSNRLYKIITKNEDLKNEWIALGTFQSFLNDKES